MPNLWTHILFCEEIMESVNTENSQEEWNTVQPFLNLGAQGPDPFFYHHFLPWRKPSAVNELGSVLHYYHCGPFLMSLIDKAIGVSTATKAYILGFVTHHILDRNTHPFIHYFSGYEKNKHQVLEVTIDTIMMERYRHLQTWKTPVYKEINVGASIPQEIEDMIDEAISIYYPDEHNRTEKHYVQAAYKDFKQALRILYDPYGWKNILLGSTINPFSHQPITSNHDYLNEAREQWRHSATYETQHESFIDLYDQARAEGVEIINELLHYWKEPTEDKRHYLETLLANISYDTGKPVEEDWSNQYSNPVV
ncbi:zinc dependent phospholipase C family protein [Pontibacillus salicampi]|uniref:Zinc dependent phospholipase C family protein n=1 Tax=Pontibacillus salicampi TaxID=1449801 RepID=A0ABV6LM21_9BACI